MLSTTPPNAFLADTTSGRVFPLSPRPPRGGPFQPRAHHAASALGSRVYLVGGRQHSTPLSGDEFLAVLDTDAAPSAPPSPGAVTPLSGYRTPLAPVWTTKMRWMRPAEVSGPVPAPVSSHKAAVLAVPAPLMGPAGCAPPHSPSPAMVVFGGCVAPRMRRVRLAHVLAARGERGRLEWARLGAGRGDSAGGRGQADAVPSVRAQHAMAPGPGGSVIVVGGYAGEGKWLGDAWILRARGADPSGGLCGGLSGAPPDRSGAAAPLQSPPWGTLSPPRHSVETDPLPASPAPLLRSSGANGRRVVVPDSVDTGAGSPRRSPPRERVAPVLPHAADGWRPVRKRSRSPGPGADFGVAEAGAGPDGAVDERARAEIARLRGSLLEKDKELRKVGRCRRTGVRPVGVGTVSSTAFCDSVGFCQAVSLLRRRASGLRCALASRVPAHDVPHI